jgi:hypothetical protein
MIRLHIRRPLSLLIAAAALAATLTSCTGKVLYRETVDGLTYTLHGTGDRVEQITVTRDGKRVGIYRKRGLRGEAHGENYGFRLTDLNFDGKLDMQLMVAQSEAGNGYATYLWDEASGKYVYHTKLSTLQDIDTIASLGVITAREYTLEIDPATDDTPEFEIRTEAFVIYRWQGESLTPIHRKELIYYEESDIYCYLITEVDEQGEWEIIRESWITADRFDPDKCPLNAHGFAEYTDE